MAVVVGQPDFSNPCGGARWRTLGDGTIEVEGRGVLMPQAGFAKYVEQSWANFEPEIRAASAKRDVPTAWLLAIIATETGLWSGSRQKQAVIASDCCVGPMAVMVSPHPNYKTFGGYSSAQDMYDPAKNIDTGAAIVRSWIDKGYDLPPILARYNSGGLCCANSPAVASKPGGRVQNPYNLCSAAISGISYPEMAIMAQNYARSVLGLADGGKFPMAALGLAFAGVGVAAAVWIARKG